MNEQFIISIMEKFAALDIAALELTVADTTVCLQKNAAFGPTKIVQNGVGAGFVPQTVPIQAAVMSPAVQAVPGVSSLPAADTASKSVKAADGGLTVNSPIVGTFYRSPSPDAPVYVEEGKTVKKGEPLCILEAMKMMNTLEAEYDCVIEKILASNGDLIEFDQPLFQVRKI